MLKVVSEKNPAPVYLANLTRLPNILRTEQKIKLAGIYFVGEGRYSVEWMFYETVGPRGESWWKGVDASGRAIEA